MSPASDDRARATLAATGRCRFARAAGGGKAGLGALTDQTALEFRQCAEHVKNQPPLRGRRVSVRLRKPMPLTRTVSTVSINCFIDRASRSSFHTISV